jgi:hypothetical protein
VVQREAAGDEIELLVGERQPRRVAGDEDDVALTGVAGRPRAGCQHLGGQVDDDGEGGRTRQVARELPGAAGHVEHRVGRRHRDVGADPLEDVVRPEDRPGALERRRLARELAARDLAVRRVGAIHRASVTRIARPDRAAERSNLRPARRSRMCGRPTSSRPCPAARHQRRARARADARHRDRQRP